MILTLAAWLHDLDPFAIGPIRWYGLSYLFGFFLGYLLVLRVTKVGLSTVKPAEVSDYIITVAIGIVIGGRLGYCLFYKPELFVTLEWATLPVVGIDVPVWGPFALWAGGMASHGGIAGGIAACWYYARRHQHDLPHLLDLFAFGAPLGLVGGRLANFINGELFGRPAPDSLPWAVKFPQELYDDPDLAWRAQTLTDLSVNQIILAIQDGDAHVRTLIEPILTPRHPSQIYGAFAEGLVTFLVLLWVWRKPRLPGVVGSWFCLTYASMRIIDEFFRRPDLHLQDQEFAAIGITRGQWLSAILFAVGVWGLWFSKRRAKRGVRPMGSWQSPTTDATTEQNADERG